ncbi:hypothetical protein Glove_166g98 [Diversispora epigaea]|uniref:Uncharacterized protein n=1 Tax=Diversispora epigaea TaxID=1348612 RepID=A0A397ITJ5_9GLOM|nr:hypothetical protein Glove_166g98 [Diversispora epigaea]
MIKEEPGIKIIYDANTEFQPIPIYLSNPNVSKGGNCSAYFDEKFAVPNSYGYNLAYLPKGQILLNDSEAEYLLFTIQINDDTYDHLNQTSPMRIHALDSDYPYQNKNPPKFIESIEVENKYYLTQSNGTNAKKRRIGWFVSYPTRTNVVYSITTETIEYAGSSNIYAKLVITLKTSLIEIEKEQRARTVLEVLANIAALYGLTFSTYVLLFGERIKKPLLKKCMAAEDPSDEIKD